MKRYLLLLVFCLLAVGVQAQSYWEKLKSPYGGEPTQMAETSNGKVYATFYDSVVYCSDDNGIHWNQIFSPSPDLTNGMQDIRIGRAGTLFSVKLIASSPYPYQYNIFRSDDNGASWQMMLAATEISDLTQTSNGNLFALRIRTVPNGYQPEVVRSVDGGVTWQMVFDQFDESYDRQIEVDQYDHLIVTDHLGDITRHYYSVNQGITWEKASFVDFDAGLHIIAHEYLFFCPGSSPYNLSRWNPATQQSEAIALYLDSAPSLLAFPDGKIWVSTNAHTYESTNSGQTWNELFQDFNPSDFPLNGVLSDGTILANSSGGIYRSATQGQSWLFSAHDMNRGEAQDFIACSATEWVAMTGAGLWETSDEGQNWSLKKQAIQNIIGSSYESLAKDSGEVFYMRTRESLFRYERGIGVFTDITPVWGIPALWNGIGVNPATHTVFATTPFGIVRSSDQGANWQTVADTFSLQKMEIHPWGSMYAIMDSIYWVPSSFNAKSYLFVSTDDGLHWTKARPESNFKDFTIAPDGIIYANINSRLFKSLDGGQTWIQKEGFFYGAVLTTPFTSTGKTSELSLPTARGWMWYSTRIWFLPIHF